MKRDTRELILETSLALFNHLGENRVTTNHIADETGISPGNLYYHFRSKDEIVLELFKRFAVSLAPLIDVPARSELHAEDLWFQLHLTFEAKGAYRFLYRNLGDLCERIPRLGHAFRALHERERRSATELLDALERQGALQIGPTEKSLLLNNLMLALTYWIPFAHAFARNGLHDGKAQPRAIAGVLMMIIPYLRPPEREQFTQLMGAYLGQGE